MGAGTKAGTACGKRDLLSQAHLWTPLPSQGLKQALAGYSTVDQAEQGHVMSNPHLEASHMLRSRATSALNLGAPVVSATG